MKIAVAQLNPTIGDLQGNAWKIRGTIRQAAKDGAHLVVLPEMALTGYPPRDLLLYDTFLEEVSKTVLEEIIPYTSAISVLLGVPWKEVTAGEERLYNTALWLGNGKILSGHYKTLLPNYDVFDESRYFTPASRRRAVDFMGQKIAVTVCEDIWNDKDCWERRLYAEDPLEELFGQGAGILVNISASPYHLGKAALRKKMLCTLAGKYRTVVVYANQVGGNDELIFDGSSMICSPAGVTVYQAEPFEEELFYCDVEGMGVTAVAARKGAKAAYSSGHFFCGNEFKARSGSEEKAAWAFAALRLGLRDYLLKTGFDRAAVGLSGGIDSAVTAALAVAALGPERVLGVLMPSRYSSTHSTKDALELAENLDIKKRLISIEEPFKAFLDLFNGSTAPTMDLAEENIQARIRGNILMFICNRERRLLLTTGNKSEMAVGYCTLYGDMSGGLAVLADVPKTLVYRIAKFINAAAGREIIPHNVIAKEPSAELRPDQRDLESLPPYEILDEILHYYIEENWQGDRIASLGFDTELVENVIEKVDRAEYKRYQAPPGLRITTRAFGSGRRMPIARGKFHIAKTFPKNVDKPARPC